MPIKVWLPSPADLDTECLRQAVNLSNLPFAFQHVALMPDAHTGYGMPIGGVLATQDVIIPNAVGVDIGCGMGFVHTNVPAGLLRDVKTPNGTLAQHLVGQIMRDVPQGFEHHRHRQESEFLDRFPWAHSIITETRSCPLDEAYLQLGTLGGGNHFIELQEDEQGYLGIMVHTGSRNVGFKVANYFNRLAKGLNRAMASPVPPEYDLAYLPLDTKEAAGYLDWMGFALEFARHNRERIMERVKDLVLSGLKRYGGVGDIRISKQVNAHHNYAVQNATLARRFGCIGRGLRARRGELAIIPGAMGSYSFIVEGLGNPESFHSASHGAGRVMGRKEAVRHIQCGRSAR